MHAVSSPLAYPTSSPSQEAPRKKRKLDEERIPLQTVVPNSFPKVRAGFLLDDSDNDEDQDTPFTAWPMHKERAPESGIETPVEDDPAVGLYSDTREGATIPRTEASQIPTQLSERSTNVQESISGVRRRLSVRTCSGKALSLSVKEGRSTTSFEQMVSARSNIIPGRARKSYYGIDIHALMDECSKDKLTRQTLKKDVVVAPERFEEQLTSPTPSLANASKLMWTEKYRARKFTDLVGDERTHRSVLRWVKAWDPIVFPSSSRPKLSKGKKPDDEEPERTHRKVLLITGPPGLGKTTLAHVCARQAGYEVQEINASDERSRDVVKGRIRDMVCTETVRPVENNSTGKLKQIARPVCVVVDEVDGVVGGSGAGGDGGFIKALVDLLVLDQKNSNALKMRNTSTETRKKRKGDNFRLQRPLILICNDLYHPSLRLLRQGNMAEIVHVRKPPLNMIIPRLQRIFEKEGIPCDGDGIRQLCEATWGVSTKKENRSSSSTADGDMRGILVVGEWVASKLRAEARSLPEPVRLTRKWLEQNILGDLMHGGGAARGLGRGSSKEIVEKVFAYNAGYPVNLQNCRNLVGSQATLGPTEAAKESAMQRLKAMIDSSGEDDRIMTDCFSDYANRPFQDDNFLSKPCIAYEWLNFHDILSNLVHTSQEWELAAYLSSPVLAFHHLFSSTSAHSHQGFTNFVPNGAGGEVDDAASVIDQIPFTGLRASYEAHEAQKAASATLTQLQSQLSLPLLRSFRSSDHLATDLLPYVLRILNPDVKPVVVGGSEKGIASVRRGPERELVLRAVNAMIACDVKFERSKVESEPIVNGSRAAAAATGWIYRMEPPLDALGVFQTTTKNTDTVSGANKVRFAVRQVLEQEWRREVAKRDQEARVRRVTDTVRGETLGSSAPAMNLRDIAKSKGDLPSQGATKIKKDFFGRPVIVTPSGLDDESKNHSQRNRAQEEVWRETDDHGRIWVTYHEGFSNAVRKGITLKELLEGL